MRRCQQLGVLARARIWPRIPIQAAFFEFTVTVMTAGAMLWQQGLEVQPGFTRGSLLERLHWKLQYPRRFLTTEDWKPITFFHYSPAGCVFRLNTEAIQQCIWFFIREVSLIDYSAGDGEITLSLPQLLHMDGRYNALFLLKISVH